MTGYTIDYGVQDVRGTTAGSDEGLDDAVKPAVLARKDALERDPYEDHAGNPRKIDLTLVDAGWRTEAIYEVCRDLGMDWKPAMGFGKSNGCVKTSFTGPVHSTPDKKVGDRWFLSSARKASGYAAWTLTSGNRGSTIVGCPIRTRPGPCSCSAPEATGPTG